MNAVIRETPKEAAHRLLAHLIRQGYEPKALHEYHNADGTLIYWRPRLEHANPRPDQKRKHVLPMRLNGQGYELKEPDFPNGKPLYGLDVLAANPDAVVYVVEGEKDADALHKLGMVAVTSSGGSGGADKADWTPMQGRTAREWPDNDEPGTKYAADVVRHLHALGCTVRLIAREVVDVLPEGGDVVDWLEAHPDATAADIAALPTVAADTGSAGQAAEPEPLRRPMPPPEPYPMDALGDVLGNAARAIHDVVKAPAAMCGTSILAAASLAAQAQANVVHDSFNEPLSLWAVTIGESGERKSAVDTSALGAHRKHEKDKQADYRAALQNYATDKAAYDAAMQKAKGGKDKNRDTLRRSLADVGNAPDKPLVPILTMGEPTLEGAQKQLIEGWPSLGLFSADAGEFLGGFSMSRENKTRTAASLSKLWDNGCFDRVRAKADEISGKHYGKRLALYFMVQPVIAERVLSDEVLAGQGFLPRCLLAWPESTIGTRKYEPRDLHQHPALKRYWAKVHALLDKPYPLTEGTRNELAPRSLTLTPEARALWAQFHNAIEHQQADKGDYASVKAWASKTPAQVLRIAGVLTLIDNPDAETIDADVIERAAELALWHLGEAVRIVGTAAVPREVKDAEALRDWCHETGRRLLHSRAALRLGPGSIRTNDNFSAAVQVLERTGWALPIEGGAVVDSKPRRRVWQVVGGEI